MSGFDPEAYADAMKLALDAEVLGADVQAFPMAAPPFPVVGFFFSGFVRDTFDGTGTATFYIRTAFTYGAEDSLRALYRMISRGAGHASSITDALLASRTLGGVIHDIKVGDEVSLSPGGEENAGLFIGSIRVDLMTLQEA